MIFFNICKCLLLSLLIKHNLYNDKVVKIFLKNMHNCGVITTKMIQWSIPYLKIINYDENIIKIFEKTYEECPIHSLEWTEKIYENDLYENIHDNYDILDVVGSGSIAQVYKIKCKKTNKIYALKVKHPNTENNFRIIKYYMKIIFFIFSFNNILPIELEKFLNQFESQLNFVNEANNLLKFNELYNNNNIFKIPKLYKLSKNLILMEYINGKSLNYFRNKIEHYKYHLCIYIFINNNLFINDFNHGDLHNYNWKITDDNKIIIYDFGLCWELNNNKIIDTFEIMNEAFYKKNKDMIYNGFKKCILIDSNINEDIIKKYYDKISHKIHDTQSLCKYLLLFCTNNNINININLLYIIISYQNCALTFKEYYGITEDFDHNNIYKEEYNMCDYFDILPEYQIHLKKQIDRFKIKSINIDYKNLYKFIK